MSTTAAVATAIVTGILLAALGLGVWMAIAAVVALVLGRVLRRRDAQIPTSTTTTAGPLPPAAARCACPDCPSCWTRR